MSGKERGRAYSKFRYIHFTVSVSDYASLSLTETRSPQLGSLTRSFLAPMSGTDSITILNCRVWRWNKARGVGGRRSSSMTRRKGLHHVCQDEGLAPAPPWGLGSCCGLTHWILNFKWPAKCQTGLATRPPDTQGQQESCTEHRHAFPSPSLAEQICLLNTNPLLINILNNVHFATSAEKVFCCCCCCLTKHACPPNLLNFTV